MKVLELFAGTRSIGKAFEKHGHEVFSVEWNKDFENIDLYEDIGKITAQDIIDKFGYPDIIWASPDCTTYSLAAISKHRVKNTETGNLEPITEYAKFCDSVNAHVIDLIKELKPKYFFIENPRGGLCNMSFMQGIPKHLATYCFASETEIVTDNGIVQIGDVCGKKINVLDGNGNFVTTVVKNYGASELMKLSLTRHGVQKVIYTTPNHKWFVSHNKKGLVETKDLKDID